MNDTIRYLDKVAFIETISSYNGKIFKILPISEGRDKDGNITRSEQEAYDDYQNYLSNFSVELKGFYNQRNSFDFNFDEKKLNKFLYHLREIINFVDGLKKLKQEITKL